MNCDCACRISCGAKWKWWDFIRIGRWEKSWKFNLFNQLIEIQWIFSFQQSQSIEPLHVLCAMWSTRTQDFFIVNDLRIQTNEIFNAKTTKKCFESNIKSQEATIRSSRIFRLHFSLSVYSVSVNIIYSRTNQFINFVDRGNLFCFQLALGSYLMDTPSTRKYWHNKSTISLKVVVQLICSLSQCKVLERKRKTHCVFRKTRWI